MAMALPAQTDATLAAIRNGPKLRPTQTVDKSAPVIRVEGEQLRKVGPPQTNGFVGGPPLPPPPPPPNLPHNFSVNIDRNAFLSQIQTGKKLKKTKTNDRSGLLVKDTTANGHDEATREPLVADRANEKENANKSNDFLNELKAVTSSNKSPTFSPPMNFPLKVQTPNGVLKPSELSPPPPPPPISSPPALNASFNKFSSIQEKSKTELVKVKTELKVVVNGNIQNDTQKKDTEIKSQNSLKPKREAAPMAPLELTPPAYSCQPKKEILFNKEGVFKSSSESRPSSIIRATEPEPLQEHLAGAVRRAKSSLSESSISTGDEPDADVPRPSPLNTHLISRFESPGAPSPPTPSSPTARVLPSVNKLKNNFENESIKKKPIKGQHAPRILPDVSKLTDNFEARNTSTDKQLFNGNGPSTPSSNVAQLGHNYRSVKQAKQSETPAQVRPDAVSHSPASLQRQTWLVTKEKKVEIKGGAATVETLNIVKETVVESDFAQVANMDLDFFRKNFKFNIDLNNDSVVSLERR